MLNKDHEVTWTPENISRFWNFYNSLPALENTWFTQQVGYGLINFVSRLITLRGDILDYGTGRGYLMEYLLKNTDGGIFGCDFAPAAVEYVNARYKNIRNFEGCSLIHKFPSPFDASTFNFVFLIEALEHLTDEYFDITLDEIKRVLTRDGIIVVTTPNDENLDAQKIICPECGCIFHRMQHVRSFNEQQLNKTFANKGFDIVFCGSVNLKNYNHDNLLKRSVANLLKKFSKNKQPHLVYIGRKKDE